MVGLTLINDYCVFTFVSNTAGDYMIELQIEDFTDKASTTSLSSVPVKILARVQAGITDNCFDGTNDAQSDIGVLSKTLTGAINEVDSRLTPEVATLQTNLAIQDEQIKGQATQLSFQDGQIKGH